MLNTFHKLPILLLLSQSLLAANASSAADAQATKKIPRSSPRHNHTILKNLEQSYELFMPSDFHQMPRPDFTIDLLKKFLKLNPCIEKTCAPISLFRVAALHQNDMYIFYSPMLREEEQLKSDLAISLAEKKHFAGALETKIFVYVATSHEGETEFLFWISHFEQSEFDRATHEVKSQLKNMQSEYIKNLLIKYGFLPIEENRSPDHEHNVHFEKLSMESMVNSGAQETPRTQGSDLSPKNASKHLSEASKARAFFRKKRPSQTSSEKTSSTSAHITPPHSPTAPSAAKNNFIYSHQSPQIPTLSLAGHDLAYLYEQGLCLRITQEENSFVLSVEKIKDYEEQGKLDDILPSSPKVNARAKHQGAYVINQPQKFYSQAKSSPEVIGFEPNEPTFCRPPIKKRSNSTPPNRQINPGSPKSPRS